MKTISYSILYHRSGKLWLFGCNNGRISLWFFPYDRKRLPYSEFIICFVVPRHLAMTLLPGPAAFFSFILNRDASRSVTMKSFSISCAASYSLCLYGTTTAVLRELLLLCLLFTSAYSWSYAFDSPSLFHISFLCMFLLFLLSSLPLQNALLGRSCPHN